MKCPKCSAPMIMVEYAYGHPERYDGISEHFCEPCNYRIGRWTGKELKEGEYEKRFGGK